MIDQRIGKIKVRRGTDSQRITNVFEEGEVIYSVDKKRIFVGDDVTLGGVPVSNRNYIVNSLGVPPIFPDGVLEGDIIHDKSNSKTYIVNSNNGTLELLIIVDGNSSSNLKTQISDIYTKLRTLTSCLTPPPPPPPPPSKLNWVVQPSNFSINVGDTVTFSSSAVGTGNITYEWKRRDALTINTTNVFQKSFTITSAGIPDIATYYCVASNSIDSITSRDAVLSIGSNSILAEDGTYVLSELSEFIDWEYTVVAPIITKQPVSVSVIAGTSVTFRVEAMGTDPLNYQWRVGGTNVAGETKNTYTIINPTVDINSISCKVSNIGGDVLSNSVNLKVGTIPTITTQPDSQTVYTGFSVTFSVMATGSAPLSYQWRKNGIVINGATSRTYTINLVEESDYSCVVSNDYGSTTSNNAKLSKILQNRTWYSVAMSSDGTKQTAVDFSGGIYISTDSGNTWTAKESIRFWVSVAMSSDGTKQTAVDSDLFTGQIYISTDSGNTWTAKESNRSWASVAMSSDGTKQTAVAYNRQIYISTDSGNTWTPKDSARRWYSVAMSSDGTKQAAVVYNGQIYISSDSGNTWTAKESNRSWASVAMSSDGTKQTAVVSNGGQIYISTDSGNTWTAKESNRSWASVAMSSDGTKQTAVVSQGQIYISTDSGDTWTAKESNRQWDSVAMSSDGTKQTAVVNQGQIYISTDSGDTWTAKF